MIGLKETRTAQTPPLTATNPPSARVFDTMFVSSSFLYICCSTPIAPPPWDGTDPQFGGHQRRHHDPASATHRAGGLSIGVTG
jgi:hypothetical protein